MSCRFVYQNVELVRVAKKITKKRIAESLNLSLQGYRYIASGNVSLGVERLKIISQVLQEDVRIFFDDELTDSVIRDLNSPKTYKEAWKMLKVIPPKEIEKLKKNIAALEYIMQIDTNQKDKTIHQNALDAMKQALARLEK